MPELGTRITHYWRESKNSMRHAESENLLGVGWRNEKMLGISDIVRDVKTQSFTAIRFFIIFFLSKTMQAWGPKVVVPFCPNIKKDYSF